MRERAGGESGTEGGGGEAWQGRRTRGGQQAAPALQATSSLQSSQRRQAGAGGTPRLGSADAVPFATVALERVPLPSGDRPGLAELTWAESQA